MSIEILPSTQMREIVSVDPSTGRENGRVRLMNASEVAAAVKRARQAQAVWSQLSFRARARFVLRAREVVLDQVDEIASVDRKSVV